MPYTAITQYPTTTQLTSFNWATKNSPNPRLSAPIASTDTTIYLTNAPKDKDGVVITAGFLMGIKSSTGATETVYVPAAGLSVDGLTATGCVRGIRPTGLDYTTGDTNYAMDFDQDSPVSCVVDSFYNRALTSAINGTVGATMKFSSPPTFVGAGIIAAPVYANTTARNAAITAPANGMECYVTADGVFYDYQGGAWVGRATGSTPNASATVAGKVEVATSAEIDADTATGGTGAVIGVSPDQLVLSKYGTRLPTAGEKTLLGGITADAAEINKLDGASVNVTAANLNDLTDGTDTTLHSHAVRAINAGSFTRNFTSATGTVDIAHGLGTVPRLIKFSWIIEQSTDGQYNTGVGHWITPSTNIALGSTGALVQALTYAIMCYTGTGAGQTATVSAVDSTNFTLSWVKGGSPSGQIDVIWEAFA